MSLRRHIVAAMMGLGILVLAAAGPVKAQEEKLAKLRSEFERTQDPVDKARKATKLGDALMEKMTQTIRADNFEAAAHAVEEYRDAVTTAFNGLQDSPRNPEKKPAGFKHLQIHVRRSIRRISDAATAMPFEMRSSFNVVLKDLNDVESKLIQLLFPRQPGRAQEKGGAEGGE